MIKLILHHLARTTLLLLVQRTRRKITRVPHNDFFILSHFSSRALFLCSMRSQRFIVYPLPILLAILFSFLRLQQRHVSMVFFRVSNDDALQFLNVTLTFRSELRQNVICKMQFQTVTGQASSVNQNTGNSIGCALRSSLLILIFNFPGHIKGESLHQEFKHR